MPWPQGEGTAYNCTMSETGLASRPAAKFSDPRLTAKGEERAWVSPRAPLLEAKRGKTLFEGVDPFTNLLP